MTNVGQNMKCVYISDVGEILTFKPFKGFKKQGNRDSAVSIATGYGLDHKGLELEPR
jgi:hypothetical protein